MGCWPPQYPTRVRMTPGTLPNWESGPQNQPSAKVAVSNVAGTVSSTGGRSFFAVDCMESSVDEPFIDAGSIGVGFWHAASASVSARAARVLFMVYQRTTVRAGFPKSSAVREVQAIAGFHRDLDLGEQRRSVCGVEVWPS